MQSDVLGGGTPLLGTLGVAAAIVITPSCSTAGRMSPGQAAPADGALPLSAEGSSAVGADSEAGEDSPIADGIADGIVQQPESSVPPEAAAEAGGGADAASTGGATDAMAPAPPTDATPPQGDGPTGGRDLSTDRGKFFGASRCAQAHVQLCEGFETGTLDTTTWTRQGTPPVIDGLQAARGTKALHVTQAGNGLSYIRESKTFPEPNDTYYGRAFFFFKSLPAAPLTYAHWTFVAASGTGVPGEIRLSGQLQGGRNLFGVGTDNRTDGGSGDWTNSDNDPKGAPLAVPLGQWVCIEWLHKGDTNETRFFWDAVEHPSLYTSAAMHGGNGNPYLLPTFRSVWIGWQEYQTTTETFEIWIDEIAIDPERIGCVL